MTPRRLIPVPFKRLPLFAFELTTQLRWCDGMAWMPFIDEWAMWPGALASEELPLCAIANELDSASTAASVIIEAFIFISLFISLLSLRERFSRPERFKPRGNIRFRGWRLNQS